MAFLELLVVGFAVAGIVLVVKEKRLSAVAKFCGFFLC